MTPDVILKETVVDAQEKTMTTVYGSLVLDACQYIGADIDDGAALYEAYSKLSNENFIEDTLFIPLMNGELVSLFINGWNIKWVDYSEGVAYGIIDLDVEIRFNWKEEDGLVAANYLVNELTCNISNIIFNTMNGDEIEVEVNGFEIHWQDAMSDY
jgi:hypothetical protein